MGNDGTNAGTQLVKDIYNGSASSNPFSFSVVNNTLLFYANNAEQTERSYGHLTVQALEPFW
jgi:hypothetical protein